MSGKATSLISVVLITDASLTVAEEWHRILNDCVGSIIQRLILEIHHESEMRLGFVAYGAAAGPEGPIIDQRYFQDHKSLTRDLTTKHSEMGIGRASGKCEIGLAALEAYACALEMFDQQRHAANFQPLKIINLNALNAEKESPKTYDQHNYIIHIAAAEPDDARRPQHNDSVAYDELNWDILPSEIKKHNICLCMNLLKPIKPFQDLFDAVSEGPLSTPWFTKPPKHTLLLYGFPTPRNKSPKRPSEVSGSPIQKRSRTKDVPSPSSPAKANSSSSPYMPPAAVKTPKQAPAVPKPPTPAASKPPPAAPPTELKSTPVSNAAQLATPAPAPAPMPAPPPAPAPVPAPPAAPAPAPAPNMPGQAPRGRPSVLGVLGFYTDIKTHPRYELGLQNPQHRALVQFMEKYDPIYTEQMIKATQRRRNGQPDPPEFIVQMRKLRSLYDLGAQALRQWNDSGLPVNFDQIKECATIRASSAAPPNPTAAAGAQGQAGQGKAPNQNLGPAAQGMLNQMNEAAAKLAAQRGGMPPPAAQPNAGAGARPSSQPTFPQQQPPPHVPPSPSPANPFVPQNHQRWTGGLIIQFPRPNAQAQFLRLEVIAIHQTMGDAMMSTWPQNIEMKMMPNLTFAPKDLDGWLAGLKKRGRSFSIVRIQAADNPNPNVRETMKHNLAKVVETLAGRACLGIASWNIPGKGNVPTAIFTRMPAGAPENHLIAIVFPQAGFDKSDLPPNLANAVARPQGQGTPQQHQNQNGQMPKQQQKPPGSNGMGGGGGGRVPSAQEMAAMQRIAQEMNIPWDTFQNLSDVEKRKVVQVYTSRRQGVNNGIMPGGGAGNGMRPGMPGVGVNSTVGLQMQQLQAALLNRAGVQPVTGNAFAGISASTPGFVGMGAGGVGNSLGGLNPGINVGALGGMQPQGAGLMGGGFPMSQDQINSWMQRSGR